MRIPIRVFTIAFLCYACVQPSPLRETLRVNETNTFEMSPKVITRAIEKEFPGALPYKEGIDSLIEHLARFGIPTTSILWGQSTCVDDITNTKNKLIPETKGPFNFGGLAGLPFTGITGLDAFSHHVPEDGTAILFIGPHIGYHEKEGWGKILRHDQHHTSSCCGALSAALSKLQKGELKPQVPSGEDYQEGMIEQLAYAHRDEILASPEPLIALTHVTYHEAVKLMSAYASKVRERHFKYAVVVGGIIINTDYRFPDYVWIEKISVLDVKKNIWLEGVKPIE
jgi:hypothetical protein